MKYLHPIVLEASLHEYIWGGRRIEHDMGKRLPPDVLIGESWETELNTIAQNEPYRGKTLGTLVEELGIDLLGEQATTIFGNRFPLLTKFMDANDKLSVQVHPDDAYAALYENGKLGKTEFWYILDAKPGAWIGHGFNTSTSSTEVRQAIENVTLDDLIHKEPVSAGDIIFVPAGTIHSVGGGVFFYEVEEYSDVTYRLYDHGRLTATGTPRELHIEHALAVSHFEKSPHIKMKAVLLVGKEGFQDLCLVACKYFITRQLIFQQSNASNGSMKSKTEGSCIILTSLGAEVQVHHGYSLEYAEKLSRGQTMVLPASLGQYCIEGEGALLFSYVPTPGDEAWSAWNAQNGV